MKKINASIKLILFVSLLISIPMSAHSGGTDSDGGHYDRSTGEYHYHHGYSAHDHYDMNDDGVLDCPYEFKKQETSKSSDSSKYSSYSTTSPKNTTTKVVETKTITETVTVEVPYIPSWVRWIIGGLVATCIILFGWFRSASVEAKDWEDRYSNTVTEHERSIAEIKQTCSAKIEHNQKILKSEIQSLKETKLKLEKDLYIKTEQFDLLSSLAKDYLNDSQIEELFSLVDVDITTPNIPEGVYFINGNVPVKGNVTDRKPFGDYTIYVSKQGKRYHADPYCGNGLYKAKHIFKVAGSREPCKICNPPMAQIPDWYREYIESRTRR